MSDLQNYFKNIREQFPQLKQQINGHPLTYLDSTNTTLKPQTVIDRITRFYTMENSNVHRGGYTLSQTTTQAFEDTRKKVAAFLGAEPEEIVYVRGTTEGVNFIAQTAALAFLKPGDEIMITELEHHANIVPWQLVAEQRNLVLKVCKIHDDGSIDENDFKKNLSNKTKIVSFTACSNVLGNYTPVAKLSALAHEVGAMVVIDGAQLVAQKQIRVKDLGADFFVFSSHKLFGPTGIGFVYGRKDLLEKMPPYHGGGSMISKVTFAKTTYNDIPHRFEAGTPHIEGVIGFNEALTFVSKIDFTKLREWEMHLHDLIMKGLKAIPEVIVYGTKDNKAPIISFNLKGAHNSDVAQILDEQGVEVRAGHHCAQPLMERLGVPGTIRVSLSVYNDEADVERFLKALGKAKEILL
ncbi:MAG: SufS family cysteine desulfurase [Bdellovibrionota bacterium]